MASPQCENGYTKIANELIEAIVNRITNPTWIRVALWTIRLTYGFNRKEVDSNYQAFATKLNLTEGTLRLAFLEMSDHKILIFSVKTKGTFSVSVNKNYELWKIH